MKRYQLNTLEMAIAVLMAAMRQGANEIARVPQTRAGGDASTNFAGHFLATKSEIAFGRIYNLCPDFSFTPRKKGADFFVNGKAIDIKATDLENGRLICRQGCEGKATHYVLAIVQNDLVEFHGWATEAELLRPETLNPLRPGAPPGHVLTRAELHELPEKVRGD